MPEEWEADIKLIREVLESRSDDGGKSPGPRLVGWHEAIEALARLKSVLERVTSKSQ